MRRVVALCALAACGRVGFETTDDGGSADGRPVLDALPIESDSSLLAHWTFDEPAGAAAFADVTGHGNTGTCIDCPMAGAPGKRGRAVAFGQSTAGIHVTAQPALANLSGPFTVAAWVQVAPPTGTAQYGVILSNDRDCCGTYNGFSLWSSLYQNGPALVTWAGTEVKTIASPLVPDTWAHVAGTYDGSTSRVYVDGALAATAASAVANPFTFDLWIGTMGFMAPDYHTVDTSIDELLVLGRALSPAEIAELFASY